MSIETDQRRAGMFAQTEVFVRDPWCAATLVCLGEQVVRVEPRRDHPRQCAWVFKNPHGQTVALINAIYEQSEQSLVPSMLLRAQYKRLLSATNPTDIPENLSGTDTP